MSFQRYAKYSDTDVDWVAEMPAGWALVPIKRLATLRSGGTPDKTHDEYWGGLIPWASAKDLKSEHLTDTQDHVTQFALDVGAATMVPAGSVLVVVRGMILAHTFPVTVADVPVTINQDLKAMVPNEGVDASYLAWLLRGSSAETLRRLDEAGHGTKALRMDAWTSMRVPLPPFDDQTRIAAFLDHESAKINALVNEQRRLIELLMDKRLAVASHAVTKGLNREAPVMASGVEGLGDVPAHWRVTPVKRLLRSIEQGWSPQCEGYPAEGDEWGVLKVGCVNGGVFDASDNKRLPDDLEPIPQLGLRAGDLLVSRANTRDLVGSAAVVHEDHPKLMLCDKLYRLRVDSSACHPDFLAGYLATEVARGTIEFAATGASASMVNISQGTILELRVALPPLAEQERIVSEVARVTAKIDALVAEAEHAIGLLEERRVALIVAAVTGKIDVRRLGKPEAVAA